MAGGAASSARLKRLTAILAVVAAGALLAVCAAAAGSAAPRFFFAGDGQLELHHAHFSTTLRVRYRRPDGSYDPEALARIKQFFRSRGDGAREDVSLRLVELLSYIQEHYHPRRMTLVSGYRSPEYNNGLRASGVLAAKASLHTQAMAADVAFGGVDLRHLWMQLRRLETGGVGYYRSGAFLHIDTGPPRFWEETTSRVGENLSAGNARLFARTDFDRYDSFAGAVVRLHGLTALPLYISPQARLVRAGESAPVELAAAAGMRRRDDGCWAITEAADAYELRVVSAGPLPGGLSPKISAPHFHLVLATCAPRLEKTPAEFESNPLDVAGR